jgi:phosphoribosylformylglycinamidine synthase
MKFGVVTFPGSNCDQDLIHVLKNILHCDTVNLWHKSTDLQGCDMIFLPGGFSYGDYLRTGAIAKFSPIMQEIITFANQGGIVMGICNGFQILCEAGLLPGVLIRNQNMQFICENVFIKTVNTQTLITRNLPKQVLKIPIAHAEGNYYCDSETLKSLQDNEQILFQYCDEEGNVTKEANPNGSLLNIAGIANSKKNVFGMMPHPERAADPWLRNQDGLHIFQSILLQKVSL